MFYSLRGDKRLVEIESDTTLLKIAHKAKTYWYCRPFRLIYRYQIKKTIKKASLKKEWTDEKKSI